jgi:AraC-like DNA-binding protein
LVKIAASLNDACRTRERVGAEPGLHAQLLAHGRDWSVEDVLCTYRPSDTSFEERHSRYRVALIGAGTFLCRGTAGAELLTPGSLLLGNAGECFECGHEHGAGDRCLAFGYSPQMFGRLAFDAGVRDGRFRALRVPPLDAIAPLLAEACAAWMQPAGPAGDAWEELAVRVAAVAARSAAAATRVPRTPRNAVRGVASAIRLIERDPRAPLRLHELAREAKLSRFHFVRAFAQVTGLTPHRYVLRMRLRRAAVQLAIGRSRVIDVAIDSGFRDVSNFNHAFRAEFGTTPREHRMQNGRLRPSP